MSYTHKPLPLSTVDKLDKPKTRGYAVDRREILDDERLGSLSSLSICLQGVACLAGLVWRLASPALKVLRAPPQSKGNSNPDKKLFHGFSKGVK